MKRFVLLLTVLVVRFGSFAQTAWLFDTLSWSDTVVTMNTLSTFDTMRPVRLAYMLPLQAEEEKRDRNMDRFYDFYVGALLAIHEQQAAGKVIEVYTYDTKKSLDPTREALQDIASHPVDAIIGPAYASQVDLVADFAAMDSTWMMVPFLSRIHGLESKPHVLQFNPSVEAEADTLARYLSTLGDSVQCVLLDAKTTEHIPASVLALQQVLDTFRVPVVRTTIHAILMDSLPSILRPDVENIIVFNTERYTNLQAVIPHLVNASQFAPVTLFSHLSWQNDSIPLPQIYTTVFHQPLVPEEYDEAFSAYFHHELSSTLPRYDLLGYDLTQYMLQLLEDSDSHTLDSSSTEYLGIQSDIHLSQVNEQGGWANQSIHIVRK